MNHDLVSSLPAPVMNPPRRLSRFVPSIARVLLGLMFVVFGLNGFLAFIPPPPTGIPAPAMAFFGALSATGYMIPLISATQLLAGALLLTGVAVPLALVLLAPILVNIIAYHLFLDRGSLPIPAVVVGAELYLAWVHRDAFRPLFRSARAGTRDVRT